MDHDVADAKSLISLKYTAKGTKGPYLGALGCLGVYFCLSLSAAEQPDCCTLRSVLASAGWQRKLAPVSIWGRQAVCGSKEGQSIISKFQILSKTFLC